MGPKRQTRGFKEDSEASDPPAYTRSASFSPSFLDYRGYLKRAVVVVGEVVMVLGVGVGRAETGASGR